MVKKRIGRKQRWKGVKEEKEEEKEKKKEEEEEEEENEAECGDCDAFRNTRLTNNNDDEDSERVCLPSYYRRNYRAHSDGLG
ncbi:hypothetical protein HZH66_000215 [Vespula vulgaris]|uniref:Uncharacterized protein n=1 Tax=Vespula vulgaris TaxID=7454 RepID=A0A834NKN3_VESVU|nr:hypothetical protein HZH66_000215 [Vespula vulgaris]